MNKHPEEGTCYECDQWFSDPEDLGTCYWCGLDLCLDCERNHHKPDGECLRDEQ